MIFVFKIVSYWYLLINYSVYKIASSLKSLLFTDLSYRLHRNNQWELKNFVLFYIRDIQIIGKDGILKLKGYLIFGKEKVAFLSCFLMISLDNNNNCEQQQDGQRTRSVYVTVVGTGQFFISVMKYESSFQCMPEAFFTVDDRVQCACEGERERNRETVTASLRGIARGSDEIHIHMFAIKCL